MAPSPATELFLSHAAVVVRSFWYEGLGLVGMVVGVDPAEEVEVPAAEPVLPFDGEIKDDALLAAPQPAIPRVASRSTASLPLVVPRAWCNVASNRWGEPTRGLG